ncbi:MAG TPA: YfhO family protein [Candidatus Andersenbacteria bacterium]|nr:YfhO family protein [Candidatus Andersenbacteria bacterium]
MRSFVYILLVVLIFFLSKWTIEGAYFRKDLVINTVPLENIYGKIQRSGQSPLWAPELAGGYPLLATGQLGFWYPPHMILRQFLPGVWTLNISLLLHAILASTGAFLFLKYNKLRNIASAVGAILLPLGATFVGKYESLNLILPFMWVPFLFLTLQMFMEYGKKIYFALWVGAAACSILVGHPQMALYVVFLQAIFVCCFVGMSWHRWPRALATLFGILLTLGMTSFYFLPIIDNLSDTDRASGTLKPNKEGMFDYQFTPGAFLGLIIAHPFGHHDTYHGPTNENELSSYIGPVALALAVLGIWSGRKKFPVLWFLSATLVGIGLILAIGGYSPVFPWLVSHGFAYFNAPARFFFYAHIGIVFLMAMGIDVCTSHLKSSRSRYIVQTVLVASTVVPVLLVSWFWNTGVPWEHTKTPKVAQFLHTEAGFVRIVSGKEISAVAPDDDFGIKAWNPICVTCIYRQSFIAPFDSMSGLSIKLSGLQLQDGTITLTLYTKNGEKIRESSVSTKSIIDSEWNNFIFLPLKFIANQEFYFEITSDIKKEVAPRLLIHMNPSEQYDPSGKLYNCTSGNCTQVLQADAAFRVLDGSRGVEQQDALAPYVSAGFGIGTMQWSGSLPLASLKDYNKQLGTWGDSFGLDARAMINRFAVTHIIGLFPPHREGNDVRGTSLVASVPHGDQFIRVFRNHEAFPRFGFAEEVRALSDSTDQYNTLIRIPRGQKTVVANIEKNMIFNASENTIDSVHEERTQVRITTTQAHDGFFVFRDMYLKGWNATVDGNPVHIYRTDGIFRGIFIPAGNHIVTFAYKPIWIPFAVVISTVSFAVYILLLLLCAYTRGR